MRLLVLAPTHPFPPTDGVQLRLNNMLRRFPADWEIQLLCFDRVEAATTAPLPDGLRGSVTRLPFPRTPPGTRLTQIRQLLRDEPSMIWKFYSSEFAQMVADRAPECGGILAIGLQMSQYLAAAPAGMPVAVDNYNVETLILERLAGTRTGLKRRYWQFEAGKLRRAERRLLEQAGTVYAISEIDREAMQGLAPRARIRTVSMGIDVEHLRPSARTVIERPRFTFVGAFNWHVNEDAAGWLCREVWPRVRERLPEAELYLVGREPSAVVRALGEEPSVTVTGTVDDVRPYLWESTGLLVPLRYGSGVRTKILEAFAAGRPVVSTPVGCEGLPVSRDRHLLVADDAPTFAEACVRLHESSELAERLVAAASRLVTEHDRTATDQLQAALREAFPVASSATAESAGGALVTSAER